MTWSDNHESTFTLEWLKERRFSEDTRKKREEWRTGRRKTLWNKQIIGEQLPIMNFKYVSPLITIFIIDRVALAKQGDNGIGSVRPSVRLFAYLFVCLCALSRLNRLTYDLVF